MSTRVYWVATANTSAGCCMSRTSGSPAGQSYSCTSALVWCMDRMKSAAELLQDSMHWLGDQAIHWHPPGDAPCKLLMYLLYECLIACDRLFPLHACHHAVNVTCNLLSWLCRRYGTSWHLRGSQTVMLSGSQPIGYDRSIHMVMS